MLLWCVRDRLCVVANGDESPDASRGAALASVFNISATKGFNRGLHTVSCARAALVWLNGAGALIMATLLTAGVQLRREFASHSRAVMLRDLD